MIELLNINNDFQVIHSQSIYLDILFYVLLFSYILFVIAQGNDFSYIINHRITPSSSIQDSRFHIKTWTFIWAKSNIIFSFIILIDNLFKGNIEGLTLVYISVAIIIIMFLKHTVISVIGILTEEKGFYKMLNYSNDCQIVIFSLVITPFVILSYCINMIYWPSYLIIVIYCVYHLIRTVKLLNCNQFSIFDIFLYLCALEFLPVAFFLSLHKLLSISIL